MRHFLYMQVSFSIITSVASINSFMWLPIISPELQLGSYITCLGSTVESTTETLFKQ